MATKRIVVFTSLPDLEQTGWWQALLDTPGLEALLVCRLVRPRTWRSALRSVRSNIRKHGLIFIPYRIWQGILGPRREPPRLWRKAGRTVPIERIDAPDIHVASVLATVKAWAPDIGVSVGAPILRRNLFGIPANGTINIHCGKVPDYRGAPPGFWELYTGATEIGATVHWMEESLDTGPILDRAIAPMYPHDSLPRVEARAEELGVIVLRRALGALSRGEVPSTPQPTGGRTFRFPTVKQRIVLSVRLAWRRLRLLVIPPRTMARLAVTVVLLAVLRPLRDLWRTLRAAHPVRVFTFHRVTELCRDGMTVSPAVMRKQIDYVCRHHDVLPLNRALDLLAQRARLRRPVAVITFDDGYRSVYDHAGPLLDSRRVTGCCFVSTDLVGTDRRFAHDERSVVREHLDVMGWDELADLSGRGWCLGGHTASHCRLSEVDTAGLHPELQRPLTALRDRLGTEQVPMAYPFGQREDISPEARAMVKTTGYSALLSNYGGENFPGDDPQWLRRIELGGDYDFVGWRARVHGVDRLTLLSRKNGVDS